MITKETIEKMKETIESSVTETQFNNRVAIFKRVMNYIITARNDRELYVKLLADFPAWSASFLVADNGLPLFPSVWQTEYAYLMENTTLWAMCTRKSGKSTLLSARTLHLACKNPDWRVVIYAPTERQDFVFQDIRTFLKQSDFLYIKYLKNSKDTDEEVILNNGSAIISRTIGLSTKGEFTRGEKGNQIVVDEIQMYPRQVIAQILRPILWDAYGEKKWTAIGTPSVKVNPELPADWDEWQRCSNAICREKFKSPMDTECPKCGDARNKFAYHIDYKRAIKEGCIDEERIKEDMARMTPGEIDMELRAVFPEETGRFYPLGDLHRCGHIYEWITQGIPSETYIMSVDFARKIDRTQILVGRVTDNVITYVYWKEIDPKVQKVSYELQLNMVKEIFHKFNPKWIVVDATTTQEIFIEELSKGENAIPKNRMYKDEKDNYGYVASAPRNYDMHQNHRRLLLNKQIQVPKNDSVFFQKWKMEHNQLERIPIRDGTLIRLQEPKNGFKDLAVASAMMSLFLLKPTTPAWMGVKTW
jgi:hypothetical protein